MSDLPGVSYNEMEYLKVQDLKHKQINLEGLPFIKRYPFSAEKEYRIVKIHEEEQRDVYEIDIDLDVIKRITFNSDVPKTVIESFKILVKDILLGYDIGIYQSTIFQHKTWTSHFKESAVT